MIKISFNKKYKSFPNLSEYSFEGDLVVLVGDNGSGKSHLFEIITQKNSDGFSSNTFFDEDALVAKENIIVKTFQPSLADTAADSNFLNTVTEILFNYYQNGNIDSNFSNSIDIFKGALSGVDVEKIRTRDLYLQAEVKEELRGNLRRVKDLHLKWQPNDIFSSQNISTIFREYAISRARYCKQQKVLTYQDSEKLFSKDHPEPWRILNNLFEKLGFEYRFKSDYETDDDDFKQNITLFNKKGEKLKYGISELSSGEKQIFSLVTSAFNLANIYNSNPKLLLLDEYDATLNPSLVDAYFIILKDFYLDRGHKVIMASHSTDTIYGAKKILGDIPKFYKLNKFSDGNANDINKRIEKISENENTYAFITYKVFGVYSNDLHNYLYGYIQSEEDLKDKEIDNFFISKAKKYNLVELKNKFTYWKKDDTEMFITLPTLIRHKIHHPENKNPKNRPDFTLEELKASIDFLLKIKEEIDIREHLYKKQTI